MKLPKKIQDGIAKIRGKVLDQALIVAKSLVHKDWETTKAEALHAINTMFNRNAGNVGRFDGVFQSTEIDTLSDIWMPREEREEMAVAEKHFGASSTVTRGSRMTAASALPVDPAPATTTEEAIGLVNSGNYKWVIKNGVLCLASTAEAPKLRVIGKAVSVTRL